MSDKICLSIEGNIGAGKSTLLKLLEEYFGKENIEFITEPVEFWQNCNGENLLEAFYHDPKKYAYMFQSLALSSRLQLQSSKQVKRIRILERSAVSDQCFGNICHVNGLMDDKEYAAYKNWYEFLINHINGKPDAIIYLRTNPEVAFNRVTVRNRHEENTVSIEYLEQLHLEHEKWLPQDETHDTILGVPFVTLDANDDFEHCDVKQKIFFDKITSLIDIKQ